METPETIRTSLQQGEWVTSIDFKDAYFHIPIQEHSRKYLRFHVQGQTYQFRALRFGLSTAPLEFTVIAKEVKLQGYKNAPVPRRLVGETHIPPGLSPAYSKTSGNMPKTRLAGEFGQVGAGSKTGLRPTPDRWQSLQNKIWEILLLPACPAVHVPDWFTNSHREAFSPRPATHETHTITSNKTCSANLYRCIKRRVGRSLKRTHCQRDLVTARKQTAYKLFGTQGSVSRLKRVSKPLYRPDSTCGNRQHYRSCLHKQGRGYEVKHILCPTVENLDLT